MRETAHDRPHLRILKRRRTDESPDEQRSIADDWLREERSTTDESLREERSTTDRLLDSRQDEARVVEVVAGRRTEAETALREVRTQSDEQLEQKAATLPAMAETLEHVAETLSDAAAKLTGVATTLQEESTDPVTHIERVAEDLKGTAESLEPASSCSDAAQVPGTVTVQLAEIAEGIAEITANLAEERQDVDDILRGEREATDRLVAQELKNVEAKLAQELRSDRRTLRQERRATDENLADERSQTDKAVERVQGLLVEERRHHAQAARGVATRNAFLGIVSHDLRGPLMTISGVVGLMDQQAPPDETGERMHAWADRVRRSVSVMERLIGDLLDFNSFEDGQLRVAAERLDIRAAVHGAIDAMHGVAAGKGLSLEAELPAEPMMTKYDPHRIFQVLSNLIHNAIKFTPRGGSIRVRVARTGRFCQVSVSDTGFGIPEEDLTGIFERFRQLSTPDRTGLGLGLYISKWIVEAHRGEIWAESTVGVGTTVHFPLPEERRSC